MRTPIFHIDAFTSRALAGNPAAVMPMDGFLPDALLQAIAEENNLGDTAFLVPEGENYRLRWFTPTTEMPLCGHGTLASAAVVMERLQVGRNQVTFQSASGPIAVHRTETGYRMNLPARRSETLALPLPDLALAVGVRPLAVATDAFNYIALLKSPEEVRNLEPDLHAISRLDRDGVIVTAAGDGDGDVDFVSRYFAPVKGVPEDPVTGGAHCALVPFWAKRLKKTEFRALQVSRRGGDVKCRLVGERVELEGGCVFYLEGEVEI
jgi:PhzF family phenazine biosynthesis protein